MIHFPIIFVAIAGVILFNPIKAFYFRARLYFITTMVSFLFYIMILFSFGVLTMDFR